MTRQSFLIKGINLIVKQLINIFEYIDFSWIGEPSPFFGGLRNLVTKKYTQKNFFLTEIVNQENTECHPKESSSIDITVYKEGAYQSKLNIYI